MTLKTVNIGSCFERLKSILNSNIVSDYIVVIIIHTCRAKKEKLSSCYVNE